MNYTLFRSRFSPFSCVSTEQVSGIFPDFDRANYYEWLKKGYLRRLRRGWYAFADAAEIPSISDYFAGKIYAPSYLSCEYVMARAGLIPESVVQFTSVTTLKTAVFKNEFGEFFYRSVKPRLMFGYGIEMVGEKGRLPVSVATPLKALCDFLYLNPQYDSPAEMEALRFEEDVLSELFADRAVVEQTISRFDCAAFAHRLKLLREVYNL